MEPIKGAKHLEPTKDNCPVDGTTLDLYSIFSMEFEGCPKCHGMWLVKDELRKLKNEALEGRLHWLNDEVDDIEKTTAIPIERACPTCQAASAMDRRSTVPKISRRSALERLT